MKKLLLLFAAFVAALGLFAQTTDQYVIWEGPKECGWGNGVEFDKEFFATVEPGVKIIVEYDKDAKDHTIQCEFGKWGGAAVASYEHWGLNFVTLNEDAGTITFELTPDLDNLERQVNKKDSEGNDVKDEEGNVVKESKYFDVFTLLEEKGLIMHGPCTVNKILYIPAPVPNVIWEGPKECGWGNGVEFDKEVFANVTPFEKLVVEYDKDAKEHTVQCEFGKWGGAAVASYEHWGLNFVTVDEEAGTITFELTPALDNLERQVAKKDSEGNDVKDEEGNIVKESKYFDVFTLLKERGLIMHGPSTMNKVIYYKMPTQSGDDPLEGVKDQLSNEISTAKMYNAIAYTEDSFASLKSAIEAAETALNAENATEESLNNAKNNIADAIAGLKLAEEYTSLTAGMFKHYASYEEPGNGEETNCAYELFKSTNNPYGDGSSANLNWADLKDYDKFIVTFSGNDKPRVWINRKVDNGQDGTSLEDANMLDLQEGNGKWSTTAYTTFDSDNNVFTVDLNKIKADYKGIVRLHAIKYGWNVNGIVTGMYLYKAADPLKMPKEALQEKINSAKLYDSVAKTTESYAALQNAIKIAEAELISKDATAESLTKASSDIADAIDGLVLDEGYEYLTAEMYKTYKSYEDAVEADEQTSGAYVLFESTNNPYGTGGSDNNRWADVSAYDKLIVTISGNDKPRVWINRKAYDGVDGTSIEDSNMLDMQAGNGKWSTNKYTTFDSDNNVFTVDLNKIKADYDGVARLHGIKYGWGVNGIVTGLYLYTSTDDLELPLEALRNEISNAEKCDKYLKTEESLTALQTAIEEGKAMLEESKPTVEAVKAATAKITEAIAGLKLQEGYSELTKDMFKKYDSVDNPGEGEDMNYNFILGETSAQPLGGGNISELEWAELTNYDKLIFKVKEGALRVLMNRLYFGAQQGATMSDSYMLDMHAGNSDEWSTNRYMTSENDIHTVDLRKIVDDQNFARLNAVKSNCNITAIYLYKDPTDATGYNLNFNIDNPANVVIKVNGEEINDLKAGDNEKTIGDRAKLYIAPAEGFILKTVKADNEDVTPIMDETHDGTLTKTIVKKISYEITTEEANPLEKPRIELKAAIGNAELYDNVAKTEESFKALIDAIEAGKLLMTGETTKAAIAEAIDAIEEAIKGLKLAEDYAYLTPDMFKTYASVTEPGDGVEAACANEIFAASRMPYGDKQNGYLNWADLSKYDELIITINGTVGPRFYMNRLEANGAQAATMEESKMIDIDPESSDSWSSKYLTIDDNKYTVNLKAIKKDFKFAHLHSIQPAGYEQTIFITGMYLWKNPFVPVEGVALDKSKSTMTLGETMTIEATVTPNDATDPIVTWNSSNENVATVDENGNVTATGVGTATITATCSTEEDGVFSDEFTLECYPQLGDANWDGKITITDAVDIVNYVVEKKEDAERDNAEWTKFYVAGANANKDENGKITFADASATVKLALAQPSNSSAQSRVLAAYDAIEESADALLIGGISETSGMFNIPVGLDNSMTYVALQADIILPEGVNVDVKVGNRVADSHTLQTCKFADNYIRVALFNLGNAAFADNDAPILEIVTNSNIQDSDNIVITNIFASDANANEYMLASKSGAATGVVSVNGDNIQIVKAADGVIVANAIGESVVIYTLDGKVVKSFVVKNAPERIDLSSGVYVVKVGNKTLKVVL